MSSFPDDPRLTQFLKQHRPVVPPAAADLEDRILTLVHAEANTLPLKPARPRSRHRLLWFVPSAIAAGIVATLISHQPLQPTPPSEAETAELQSFIESSWQSNVTEHRPIDGVYPDPLITEPVVN